MTIHFTYDIDMEFDNIQRGIGSYGGNRPVLLAEMETNGIDLRSREEVTKFLTAKVLWEGLDPMASVKMMREHWDPIAEEVRRRLDALFSTHDPFGATITAFLTLNSRCAYSFRGNYFFVSISGQRPIGTAVHELMHFYAHLLIEPIFAQKNKEAEFGDFKEALTVLLNHFFSDLIEREDLGYTRHAALREWIAREWREGMTAQELAFRYLSMPDSVA